MTTEEDRREMTLQCKRGTKFTNEVGCVEISETEQQYWKRQQSGCMEDTRHMQHGLQPDIGSDIAVAI